MKPILSLCLLVFAFDAGAQEMQCPERFPVDAIKLSPLPKGWTGITPYRLLLKSADVIVGHPQPGMAIGEKRKIRGGFEVAYDATSTDPNEKWLACRYGDLSLAERLPDETKSCVVRYTEQREYPGAYDIKVSCSTNALEPRKERRKN